jgi:hypothetical protein
MSDETVPATARPWEYHVRCSSCNRTARLSAALFDRVSRGETQVRCAACQTPLDVGQAQAADTGFPVPPPAPSGSGRADGTRLMGWVLFLLGVLGAIGIAAEYGSVEVPSAFGYTSTVENPLAYVVAAGTFLQGLSWLVLLLGVARSVEAAEGARDDLASLRDELSALARRQP